MKYHDYDILYHPSKQNIHPEDSQIKITNQVKKVVHSERKATDINTREKL